MLFVLAQFIMAPSHSATLPIIPLPHGIVLLPGTIQRIPVSPSRPDIPALLSTVFTRAAASGSNGRIETVPIACVPQARLSPLMGPNGQLLIENGERDYSKVAQDDSGRKISKSDLFSCGVAAKITGVEGRGTGDFSLIVEGVTRVKVEKIYQTQPYFEGKVTYLKDQGKEPLRFCWYQGLISLMPSVLIAPAILCCHGLAC